MALRTEILVKTGTVAIPTDAASVRHARNLLYSPKPPFTASSVQGALDQAASLIGTGGSGVDIFPVYQDAVNPPQRQVPCDAGTGRPGPYDEYLCLQMLS